MATVGQALTSPESGWKRIDDTHNLIKYNGDWTIGTYSKTYNETYRFTNSGIVRFTFQGTKIRLIGLIDDQYSNSIQISIDGVLENFSQYTSSTTTSIFQCLNYEKIGLTNDFHIVEIKNLDTNKRVYFDAIDIDDNGILATYKLLIKSSNSDYKYHDGSIWQSVGSKPTEQDYIDFGMELETLSTITESQWGELTSPTISFYTDNTSLSQLTTTLETNQFTLADILGDNPTFMYYTDDTSVTSADVEITANYTPLDEIDGDFDVVTWTNKPPEDVVKNQETDFDTSIEDGDLYTTTLDLTKTVKSVDEA